MSTVKSVFGPYAEQLQVLVNENMDRFKEPFFPGYFSMGNPQNNLSYSTAIGKSRIEAAAAVVAHGSESPLRSRAGLNKLSGEVAAIKLKRQMDEQQYRNWLTLQAMDVNDETKKQQIIQYIWDDVKHVYDSVNSRLDIMVKQALSKGVIDLSITANPDGAAMGDVDLLVDKKKSLKDAFGHNNDNKYWTDGTEPIDNATPLADIEELAEDMEDEGIVFGKILMTPKKFRQITKIDEVTEAFDDKRPTLDELNNWLSDRNLPIIELVTGKHTLETNGDISTYTAWDDKYVTFVPDGNLGLIHNAIAIEEVSPVASVDYAVNNRVLISKWSETEPFGEYTRGEISAFPGLEVADGMVILNTEKHSAGF